jgi:hypothetical protein
MQIKIVSVRNDPDLQRDPIKWEPFFGKIELKQTGEDQDRVSVW